MIEIPRWIQAVMLAAMALVVVGVPLRVLWELRRDARGRRRLLEGLADRLGARMEGGRVAFTAEGRPVWIRAESERELELRVDEAVSPKAPFRASSGRWGAPWIVPGCSRVRLGDPMADREWRIWTTRGFGALLQDAVLQPTPEPLVESLAVLRRIPGVKRVDLALSPDSGLRLRLNLEGEDLVYRPDLVEAALHHACRIHRRLVELA
jgi:hypothetical protein